MDLDLGAIDQAETDGRRRRAQDSRARIVGAMLELTFTGSPFVNFAGEGSKITKIAGGISRTLVKARPTLFG